MAHHKDERTLVFIKPDGVQRSLIGEIIRRFERIGLKLMGIKMLVPTVKQVEDHYLLEPGWKEAVGRKAIESYAKKGIEQPTKDALAAGGEGFWGVGENLTS